jgi:hypothetical protein
MISSCQEGSAILPFGTVTGYFRDESGEHDHGAGE